MEFKVCRAAACESGVSIINNFFFLVAAPSIGAPGSGASIIVQNNTSNSNIIQGDYATITGPLVSTNTSWLNDLVVDLSGTSADNAANFAFRVVNAATGSSETNIAGANPTKNWRFNDIVVNATDTVSSQAPTVTTNPDYAERSPRAPAATFNVTAAATGTPTPTVQWYVSNNSGATFAPDTTDSGNTTNSLTVSTVTTNESGFEYEAVYTNTVGSATTTAATLTVVAPQFQITQQPASQIVNAGSSVTLLAAASGTPTPTVQWDVSSGGSSFTTIPGATSTFLTLTASEGITANQYEAVFTNTTGTVTSDAATLTVKGTPIVQWDFAGGEAASPGGNSAPGTGNSPTPTAAITSGNSVSILGLQNSYDGLPSYPEADIIPIVSGVDTSFQDYVQGASAAAAVRDRPARPALPTAGARTPRNLPRASSSPSTPPVIPTLMC